MKENELYNSTTDVWPSIFCVDDSMVWFVQSELNCLMKYDMLVRRFEIVHQLPHTRMPGMKPYVAMICAENRIFLVPAFESFLFVYDIKSNHAWELEVYKEEDCQESLFVDTHLLGDWLWCVPDCNKKLIRVNVKTLEIQADLELTSKLRKKLGIENVWINRTYIYDNKMWGTVSNAKIVFCFGLKDKEITVKRLGMSDSQFSSLAIIDRKLFVYDKISRKIYKYMLEENLKEGGCMAVPQEYVYRIGKLGDFLIIDAGDAGVFYLYDTDFHLAFECIWDGKMRRPYSEDNLYLGQMDSNSGKTYYYNTFDNKLYLWTNKEFVEMFEFCMECPKDFWQQIGIREIQSEGRILGLSCFLAKIGKKRGCMESCKNEIGKEIWKYLK